MVIDNALLSVGSANGDARTMHDNHELNTLIYDPKTAQDFSKNVLNDDWNMAQPVTMASLKAAPWYDRLMGWALERIAFLM
jgi:phosphatidylserine/phosphatidylglycerophosphate/cardiolipin synthase-like enzyme